jgi:hypothetical protein
MLVLYLLAKSLLVCTAKKQLEHDACCMFQQLCNVDIILQC